MIFILQPLRLLGRELWRAAVCITALLLSATVAQSQGQPDAHSTSHYRTLITQAIDQYDAGNFEEAKVLFTEAHELAPNARTLRGLGLVAYAMRDYVSAIEYFGASLTNESKPLDAALTQDVQENLARARTFVGTVHVTLQPADAKLRVDAWPVELDSEGEVSLNPGSHEITVSSPGHQTVARLVRVDPGATLALSLKLPHDSSDANASVPPSSAQSSASIAPWVVTGVSAAVAIGGGVLLGIGLSEISRVEDANPASTDWSEVEDSYSRAPTLTTLGIVMLGAGVAGVATGLTWHMLEGEPGSPNRDRLALQLSPAAARLTGAF